MCSEIVQFGVPVTDDHHIYIRDKLVAHHSAYIHQTVTGRAGTRLFSIVVRPPYHPKFGPIDYKIYELTNILLMKKEPNWTM